MTQTTKVYMPQGGDALVVDNGGKFGRIAGATFTIGAEATNAITVNIQLTDALGNDLDNVGVVTGFLSDSATGLGVTATGPNTSVAAGTDGAIINTLEAVKSFILQSESDGDIDLVLTETGVATWYLVIVLPSGEQVVSNAITFA